MSSFFPDSISGGVSVRAIDGTQVPAADVQNAYNPNAKFKITCGLNYLPSNCFARITSAQINGFQSELLALAEKFKTNGEWKCDSLTNLADLFQNWWDGEVKTKLSQTRKIIAGDGLTGGGDLSQDRTISLSEATNAALKKAESAVQPKALDEIGCMRKSVYDPQGIGKDVFNSDNITEGTKHLFLTASERSALAKTLNLQRSFVGQISFFLSTDASDDWLKANGALVSRTTYPLLWAFAQGSNAIVSEADWNDGWQGCFSTGDGTSTFRLPDLRGEFLRGFDDGRGVDSGRKIGSQQDSENKAHTHSVLGAVGEYLVASGNGYGLPAISFNTTTRQGGAEARPRNISLLACIRCQ